MPALVSCPACRGKLLEIDVDRRAGRARCRACLNVFPVDRAAPSGARPADLRMLEEQTAEGVRFRFLPHPMGRRMLPLFVLLPVGALVVQQVARLRGHPFSGWLVCFGVVVAAIAAGIHAAALTIVDVEIDPRELRRHGRLRRTVRHAVPTIESFTYAPVKHRGGHVVEIGYVLSIRTGDGTTQKIGVELYDPEQTQYVIARLDEALDRVRQPRGYRG